MRSFSLIVVWLFIATFCQNNCNAETNDDYLLLGQLTKLSRYWPSTKKLEVVKVSKPTVYYAIDYDAHGNCLFWHDSNARTLQRQCFNGNDTAEVLLKLNYGTLGRMAYDWASQVLYYTNYTYSRIEAISTAPYGYSNGVRMHATVIQMENDYGPWGIAVHPRRGYLFWVAQKKRGTVLPQIVRANLDGTEQKVLLRSPQVNGPDAITIDYVTDRLYWTDRGDTKNPWISSCDLDGKDYRVVVRNADRTPNPYAIAVAGENLFWADYDRKYLLVARINRFNNVEKTLKPELPSKPFTDFETLLDFADIRELKFVSKTVQKGAAVSSLGFVATPKKKPDQKQ